jgi:NADH-quinone oxidoreductase subunit I
MRLGETEEDYYRLGLKDEDAPNVPSEGGGRASMDAAVARESGEQK